MFVDYERLVLDDYRRKKNKNALSSGLMRPTQARIKKECERLCRDKLQKKDEKVIRDFCEAWDSTKTHLQNIDNCDVDKFKPLSNFLKGNTESTDFKNIELLAWLIDFPYRPFEHGKNYSSLVKIEAGVEMPEPVEATPVDVPPLTEDPPAVDNEGRNMTTEIPEDVDRVNENRKAKENAGGVACIGDINEADVGVPNNLPRRDPVRQKWRLRKVAGGVLLAIITVASSYWWWDMKQPAAGGCMYWAADHFQPIPCNQKIPNTLVVALDTVRVKNFKKITRPDTITHLAKGYVWYSKIDNKIEFFTAGGEHPIVINHRLKPISDYIINKYIHPGMTLNQ
jgi:hypothetical protein